jgi:hypothetical protein
VVTSNISAVSAGGSAGASGVGFQNQVFAWAASCLVAEAPLQLPLVAGNVVQVGSQTGFKVDDVGVLTDLGNGMFVQAKVGMALGAAHDSPLAKALTQAVNQYLDETLPEVGTSGRPVDASRDAIVLCTDHSAPATVREDLRQALRRVASQPPGTFIGRELTGPQDAALKVALDHIQAAWGAARAGVEPTDEELRTFFRALHVLVLDLEDGRKDQQGGSQHSSSWPRRADICLVGMESPGRRGSGRLRGPPMARSTSARTCVGSAGHRYDLAVEARIGH